MINHLIWKMKALESRTILFQTLLLAYTMLLYYIIEYLSQVLVDARLEEIENRLDAIDPSTNSSCSTTPSSSSASSSAPVYTSSAAASSLSRILLDLRAARKITSTAFLNNILPD